MAKKKPSLGREKDLLRIACFVLFNAMLLGEARGTVPSSTDDLHTRLRKAWRKAEGRAGIGPIFGFANEILAAWPDGPDANRMLEVLANAAKRAARSDILQKQDFVGRIYHELLLATSGHHYAAYYTSGPAALLLAGLVLHAAPGARDFQTVGELADFRIIDPACGSGTLLSAAYHTLRDRYTPRGEIDRVQPILLEKVLHGWDVLDFSLQLTLFSLALHSRGGLPKRTNIVRKPLGMDEASVRLGSLDYLTAGKARRKKFDVVLMNPPFSRSAKPNTKFGYGEADERKAMNAALRALAKTNGLGKAAVAGLTPFFMQLGLEMASKEGRIGMVLPRSTLSGVGSANIRKKFETQTKLAFIVSNFDPGSRDERIDGWSWSENTDLGEVLITAEKEPGTAKDRNCTFVNVTRRPRNDAEARALSGRIACSRSKRSLLAGDHEEIRIRGRSFGTLYRIPQMSLNGNWLKACTFAHPPLNRLCLEVLANETMEPLHNFVELVNCEHALGRDIAAIKPNFSVAGTGSGARMVMGHQAAMNTIDLDPVHVKDGRPKDDKARLMFRNFASNLLVAERPHLLTESLLAMRAGERVVATAFWEVQAKPGCGEWLLMWLNSTYGVMTFLAHSTSSMADIFKMKKDQLRDLPVPAPRDLRNTLRLHDRLKQRRFAPYAEEFRLAAERQGPRHALDTFFASQLNLPELTRELYAALSRDPPVSRKPIG